MSLQELKTILSNSALKHVILIDDARCFTGKGDYPTIEQWRKFVNKKRPNMLLEIKNDIIRIHPKLWFYKNNILFMTIYNFTILSVVFKF